MVMMMRITNGQIDVDVDQRDLLRRETAHQEPKCGRSVLIGDLAGHRVEDAEPHHLHVDAEIEFGDERDVKRRNDDEHCRVVEEHPHHE